MKIIQASKVEDIDYSSVRLFINRKTRKKNNIIIGVDIAAEELLKKLHVPENAAIFTNINCRKR